MTAETATRAAEELFAALVVEWNGEDQPFYTQRVRAVLLRWQDEFGPDNSWEALAAAVTAEQLGSTTREMRSGRPSESAS